MKKLIAILMGFMLIMSGCTITPQTVQVIKDQIAIYSQKDTGPSIVPEPIKTVPVDTAVTPPIVKPEIIQTGLQKFTAGKNMKFCSPSVLEWKDPVHLDAKVNGGNIELRYKEMNIWETHKLNADGHELNGNIWAIYQDGDKYYACTVEWLGPNKDCLLKKEVSKFIGAYKEHTGKNYPGNDVWIFVSGLVRSPKISNVKEISNLVKVRLS